MSNVGDRNTIHLPRLPMLEPASTRGSKFRGLRRMDDRLENSTVREESGMKRSQPAK